MNDTECPNCGRTVKEINYHEDVATCVFCDINVTGP